MDSIDREIADIRKRQQEERQRRAEYRAERRLEVLEKGRAKLRALRDWNYCTCDECCRAVLSLNVPAGLCKKAQNGLNWWDVV